MQHVTADRSVFVALSRGTSPGTAAQPTCQMVQELSGSPQSATNNQPKEDLTSEGTSAPFHESNLLRNIDDSVSDLLDFTVENDLIETATASCIVVKGQLRENIAFWQSISASNWLLRVIREGYCLPFVDLPEVKFLQNHKSTLCNAEFVSSEKSKLVKSGALVEVNAANLFVCNPLDVARNSSGKPRLIVDLHYVNQHLRSCKFKYEDIRTATDLFQQGEYWFFKFDYTSGYHHVEIFPKHTKFLGCSWMVDGFCKFLEFTVLPFGLSVGPFIFTKIQRPLQSIGGGREFVYLLA